MLGGGGGTNNSQILSICATIGHVNKCITNWYEKDVRKGKTNATIDHCQICGLNCKIKLTLRNVL